MLYMYVNSNIFPIRLDISLKSFEKTRKVSCRWTQTCGQYQIQHKHFLRSKDDEVINVLFSRSAERAMLLTLKKRYAGRINTLVVFLKI